MTNDNDMRKNSKPLPGQTQLFGGAPVPPPPIAVPVPPTLQERIDERPIRPRRKRGSPGPSDIEGAALDEALNAMEEAHAKLIAEGKRIARQLAAQRGRVTSVEVFQVMRSYGYDIELDGTDPRWSGCLFSTKQGWEKIGWENTGSHKRPVAIWKRA